MTQWVSALLVTVLNTRVWESIFPSWNRSHVMRASPYRLSGQICSTIRGIALAIVAIAISTPHARSEESTAPASPAPAVSSTDALATPTHHQTGTINVNAAGLPQASLTSFCLTPDDRILAGCASEKGEIRVFDAAGKYLQTWQTPIKPEAIYVRADGAIYLAGEGQLAKLSPTGAIELQHEAPHAAAITASRDKIREEVIAENKQRASMYVDQSKVYDQMLAQVQKQIDEINAKIAARDKENADSTANDKTAADGQSGSAPPPQRFRGSLQSLERQLAMREQMKKQYEQAKSQFAEMVKQNPDRDLTDVEIDEHVKSSMQYKLKVSSISATDGNVFLATHSAVGYGFAVWKLDADFENGQSIVSDLSGCCGQMDVKVNGDALYVAENSRHRVCHYDTNGKLIGNWGTAARSGIEGFGSCCNPMNVAFGPGGVVYTAEDDTGRIKRYSPSGELLGLVGAVEVPPGCKNVSIAATSDGNRFYMLDITNSRILRMDPYGPGETPKPMKFEEKQPAAVDQQDVQTSQSSAPGAMESLVRGIIGAFTASK
jgi:hypothetical protein